MILKWMNEADLEPCRCGMIEGGRKSFIQKTLDSIFAFLRVPLCLVMVFNTIHNTIWI